MGTPSNITWSAILNYFRAERKSLVPNDPVEIKTLVGAAINDSDEKTTPVDADMIALIDSEASNVLKKLSWANIKVALKTWIESTRFTSIFFGLTTSIARVLVNREALAIDAFYDITLQTTTSGPIGGFITAVNRRSGTYATIRVYSFILDGTTLTLNLIQNLVKDDPTFSDFEITCPSTNVLRFTNKMTSGTTATLSCKIFTLNTND